MNANDLLLWLSAMGSGSWSRYRAAVDDLEPCDDPNGENEQADQGSGDTWGLPGYLRLRLDLERLGHAEFFRRAFPNGWRVVPPALVCGDMKGRAIGVLCGARTEAMMARLNDAAGELKVETDPQPGCPDGVRIEAPEQTRLKEVARLAGICFQPDGPRMLLAALPPVDDRQLRKPEEMPLGPDWDVSRFSARTLSWSSVTPQEARAVSLGLVRFNVRHQPCYYLCDRGQPFRIPVQVGKYIVLRRMRRCVLSYDAATQTLSMPVSCRPPLLIDRALTLCSGLIPPVENGQLLYRSITRDIWLTACALLRQ